MLGTGLYVNGLVVGKERERGRRDPKGESFLRDLFSVDVALLYGNFHNRVGEVDDGGVGSCLSGSLCLFQVRKDKKYFL